MEETFETRDRTRSLKVYVTPTERQSIERQTSVHRGCQPVIRTLCAWGLVLSLSAITPLAALAEDTATEGAETPVLPGTDTTAEGVDTPVLCGPVTPTGRGDGPMLRSTVTQTEFDSPLSPIVNKGDVRVVAPGTVLDLALLSEMDTDETVEGDEFFGKIIKDVQVDGQVVIPRGTVVHGVLSLLEAPKRAGRNGYINTRFDYIITPDGREVSIEGNSSTRDSKGKAAAKVVGRAAGYTAVGGVLGTLIVLRVGGLAAAAASYGSAPAGGAAIGGAAGLAVAMLMKGKSVMLQPGTEMHVKLSEPLKLPTMTMPDETAEDFSIPGLEVKVANMRINRMTEITLTLDILNETENTFSKFEIGLEDELGKVFFSSPFGSTGILSSKIKPSSHFNSKITFSVDNVKIRHKLVFFKPYSREPLAKFALTDAMQARGKARHRGKHHHGWADGRGGSRGDGEADRSPQG